MNNFFVIKDILNKDFCNLVYNYAILDEIYFKTRLKKEQYEQMYIDDQLGMHHKETFSKYGDPLMENILLIIKPQIEHFLNKKLLPTYSYYRIYRPGYELYPHVDRDECEISASIFFGCDYDLSQYQWTLNIENELDGMETIILDISDGLVYNGAMLTHSRFKFDPPSGQNHIQGFFHYVDANGPHAEQIFDKREYLAYPHLTSGR